VGSQYKHIICQTNTNVAEVFCVFGLCFTHTSGRLFLFSALEASESGVVRAETDGSHPRPETRWVSHIPAVPSEGWGRGSLDQV